MSGKNVLKYWSQVGIDRLRDRGRNEADLVVGSGQRKTKVEQLENEQVSAKSSSKVERMGVRYFFLHAFIHWRHTVGGGRLKISSIYVMAALAALCKPHSASEQKLSMPICSTLLNDFEVSVRSA